VVDLIGEQSGFYRILVDDGAITIENAPSTLQTEQLITRIRALDGAKTVRAIG
jgi:hypothetical protein